MTASGDTRQAGRWHRLHLGRLRRSPAAQGMTKLEVVAVDLISGVSVEQVFDSAGVTLGTWSQVIDGYSRLDR